MEEIRHGVNGWQLIEYDWSPTTGIGKFKYERVTEAEEGLEPTREVQNLQRMQPSGPEHVGWMT